MPPLQITAVSLETGQEREPPFPSAEDAGRQLGVSGQTIRNWVRDRAEKRGYRWGAVDPPRAAAVVPPVLERQGDDVAERLPAPLPPAAHEIFLDGLRTLRGVRIMTERDGRVPYGYGSGNSMTNASGKRYENFRDNDGTEANFQAVAASMGRPLAELEIRLPGNLGTWLHPRLLLLLGQWCSPEFAAACVEILERFATGRLTTEESGRAAAGVGAMLGAEAEALTTQAAARERILAATQRQVEVDDRARAAKLAGMERQVELEERLHAARVAAERHAAVMRREQELTARSTNIISRVRGDYNVSSKSNAFLMVDAAKEAADRMDKPRAAVVAWMQKTYRTVKGVSYNGWQSINYDLHLHPFKGRQAYMDHSSQPNERNEYPRAFFESCVNWIVERNR